jgi:chemotaxis protein MotB
MADDKRPIVIVKRKKKGGHGHHGGAWKVAYADFVTAMMAFFMVMWLVATVSDDQKAAIFEHFRNPSMEPGKAPKPAPGQMGPGGASTSPINMRGGLDAPRTIERNAVGGIGSPVKPPMPDKEIDNEELRKKAEELERKQLESLMKELKEAISKSQALAPFKDQLLLDITPEGLRIQIVDEQNRPMFDLGRARIKDYTDRILRELSPYLNSVPNRLSLTGHTDRTPYARAATYSNWELSADRANAARRSLEIGGLQPEKVARVVGLGASVLFDKQNPLNPINRRISIIVMTKRAEEAALKNDVPQVVPPTTTADAAQGPSGTASVSASAGNAALPATSIATTVAAAAAAADAAQRLRRSGANNQATARVGDLAIPLQGSAAGPSDSAARSTALRP